ncbi:MAG: FAD-dependent oxidoreductase [Candidatus Diapherotrites archaeon]|nr:FAD-dependent oxidoreductase [Candidatus Diapherotrites archaeon]
MPELDLVIVGAGPAGITAGIYAKRKGLKVELFEGLVAGGTVNEAVLVENYPGFEPIVGQKLAEKMAETAKRVGVKINESEKIVSAKKISGLFELETETGKSIKAKAIILATGASHRKINVAGAKELEGKGIAYCATCDGPLFAKKAVAIIGGGNSGAANALYMSDIASKVYLIEYAPKLMCEKAYIEKLEEKKVEIITNANVIEFVGHNSLREVRFEDRTSKKQKSVAVEGAFIYIGIEPNNHLAKQLGCELDEKGYVKVDLRMCSSVEGVFAAGDITGIFPQMIVACGQGAIAAESAYRYIKK